MKKLIFTLIVCLISTAVLAKTAKVIYSNGRFNEVRISDLSKKDAEKIAPTHPVTISEEKMRTYLRDLKLSRSFIISKEVESQDIFDDRAINFLAPKLIEGLSQATDKQMVEFSYLTKDPIFILRNDRLTIGRVWMKGTDLYITFDKLFAKLLGDYDKRGNTSKTVMKSRGLRISLDVRDGQSYGDSTGEIIIDTTHDFSKPATMTADAEAGTAPEKAVEEAKDKGKTAKAAAVVPEPQRTVRDRLKELDQLKQDGLITEKDYKRKKDEILRGL